MSAIAACKKPSRTRSAPCIVGWVKRSVPNNPRLVYRQLRAQRIPVNPPVISNNGIQHGGKT